MNMTTNTSSIQTLKWLLKREFWEHRGGFLWAPIILGSIVVGLFALLAILSSLGHGQPSSLTINGNTTDIKQILGAFGDGVLMTGVLLAGIVLAFVVFFYSLGALFDERHDRSVLFWKSLPMSDMQVVLSKAIWALLLAPMISIGIGVIIGLALWVISALTLSINGLPASAAIFTHSHPLTVVSNILSLIPVYVLWALPTVGWLMLCSVWARSKPFLWAVLLPILSCVIISTLGILPVLNIPHDTLWYTIVYRSLLSVIPGSWLSSISTQFSQSEINSPEAFSNALGSFNNWQMFSSPDLWIGAVVGIIFITIAIYLRRWRELTV